MARGRRSGRRADYRWTLGAFATAGLAAGGSVQFAIVSAGTTSQTLMRMRGNLLAWMDNSGLTADDFVRVGVGIIPIQFGGVATSLPLTDGDAPWIWHQVFTMGAVLATAFGGSEHFRTEIDSKAMRVLRPDQDIMAVIETADIVGAPVVNVGVDVRVQRT